MLAQAVGDGEDEAVGMRPAADRVLVDVAATAPAGQLEEVDIGHVRDGRNHEGAMAVPRGVPAETASSAV